MKKKDPAALLILMLLLLTLSSCIGVSTDIVMRSNGSGKITLEYRFSSMMETVGRLDGNEQWPIIPTGRADFERTVSRIPDMRLLSYSSKVSGSDNVNNVELEFANPQALLALLDPSGKHAFLNRENNSNILTIILMDDSSSEIDPDLAELLARVSSGFQLKLSFSATGNCTLVLKNLSGGAVELPAGSQIVSSGKKVSLTMGTADVLGFRQGLQASFIW